MTSLTAFIQARGFSFVPDFSGEYRRFDRNGGKNNGWFRGVRHSVNGKIVEVLYFGDWHWAHEDDHRWEGSSDLGPAELALLSNSMEKEQAEHTRKKEELHRLIADDCTNTWPALIDRGQTTYMVRKLIPELYGARISPENTDTLIIPMRDIFGKLWGFTYTSENYKQVGEGHRTKGLMHIIGDQTAPALIYVCEGFSTGTSIYQATQTMTVCAFTAGNLNNVVKDIHEKHPKAKIIVCGDDDQWPAKNGKPKPNTGEIAARDAASGCGGLLWMPVFASHDGHPTDANDLHVREGITTLQTQLRDGPTPVDEESAKEGKEEAARRSLEKAIQAFEEKYFYKMLGGSKICYVYNGKYYEEFDNQYIKCFAQEHLKPRPQKRKRDEFLDRIQISNLTPPEWFNTSTDRHVNFSNGVLNLENNKLEPHASTRGFRYCLPYDYNPGAGCPNFDTMMKKISCEDQELELVLDEFMGYALSLDRYWCHKSLVLTGEGENGKSTWLDVLRALAGKDNYASLFLKDLGDAGNRQMLDGKLFNISAEVPKKGAFDSSIIKALGSGDEVTVRKIYKSPYSMVSRAKLIFACNELPDSGDVTRGFFRRFLIIPFNAVFTDTQEDFDPHIKEKLMGELPGIFNRAVSGYRRLHKNKRFSFSQASKDTTDEYQNHNDSAKRWVDENIRVGVLTEPPNNYVPIRTLYADYAAEMEAGNMRPLSSIDFGRRLSKEIKDYKGRVITKKHDKKTERCLVNVMYQTSHNW